MPSLPRTSRLHGVMAAEGCVGAVEFRESRHLLVGDIGAAGTVPVHRLLGWVERHDEADTGALEVRLPAAAGGELRLVFVATASQAGEGVVADAAKHLDFTAGLRGFLNRRCRLRAIGELAGAAVVVAHDGLMFFVVGPQEASGMLFQSSAEIPNFREMRSIEFPAL